MRSKFSPESMMGEMTRRNGPNPTERWAGLRRKQGLAGNVIGNLVSSVALPVALNLSSYI